MFGSDGRKLLCQQQDCSVREPVENLVWSGQVQLSEIREKNHTHAESQGVFRRRQRRTPRFLLLKGGLTVLDRTWGHRPAAWGAVTKRRLARDSRGTEDVM